MVVAALIAAFIAVFANVQAQRATNTQLRIAEQGQITERYNAAITNLGSRSIDVRLGGIYALQRLMKDSPPDQPTVIAVVCAFVRDRARVSKATELPAADRHSSRPDRGRHPQYCERRPGDCRGFRPRTTCRAQLSRLHLSRADFSGADLRGATSATARTSTARSSPVIVHRGRIALTSTARTSAHRHLDGALIRGPRRPRTYARGPRAHTRPARRTPRSRAASARTSPRGPRRRDLLGADLRHGPRAARPHRRGPAVIADASRRGTSAARTSAARTSATRTSAMRTSATRRSAAPTRSRPRRQRCVAQLRAAGGSDHGPAGS